MLEITKINKCFRSILVTTIRF